MLFEVEGEPDENGVQRSAECTQARDLVQRLTQYFAQQKVQVTQQKFLSAGVEWQRSKNNEWLNKAIQAATTGDFETTKQYLADEVLVGSNADQGDWKAFVQALKQGEDVQKFSQRLSQHLLCTQFQMLPDLCDEAEQAADEDDAVVQDL